MADQGESASEQQYDPAKDPKRKAKSKDPAWKYCYWPDLNKKDVVKCILCGKIVHAGVRRLKQHLVGGHGDVAKCPKTTSAISKEMHEYLKKNARQKPLDLDDDKVGEKDDEVEVTGEGESRASHSVIQPSSGTALKRRLSVEASQSNQPASKSRSIASMLRKAPEEVVRERHCKSNTQTTLPKKSKEEKEATDMYVADFIYDSGLPLNVINSRSFEVMLEAVGQYGPGYVKPSYHEVRVPLLEKAKKSVDEIKRTHELAWAEFGCTLMADGWTDRRGRHLINFLVNSPAGTFFLESVNASSETADAQMLAALLEKRIDVIGTDNVVQIVTDNGANFKAAGRLLERKIRHLFWTPCAAHCLDLMLEDIGKIVEFKRCISRARQVTTFIYRHGKLLDATREQIGGDLVRPAVTRFATTFLTLQSIFKHKQALRCLFVSDDWTRSKLSSTEAGKKVTEILLSTNFWNSVQDCIRASQPLLIVLRIVDGDEKPAMPEVAAAMDMAKTKITLGFEGREVMKKKLLAIINRRWQDQMEVKLYGAALFLNPNKFFELQRTDPTKRELGKLRAAFNEVLWKMVVDDELQYVISKQADEYMTMAGPAFSSPLAIREQQKKSPIRWWDAYGGLAFEIQSFAKRIVSLCCSASGCERNWSTFEFEKEKQSWEAACESLRSKLEASESARLQSEVEFAKVKSQLELEMSTQNQLLQTKDSDLMAAKDEISRLESDFSAYKVRAHALLQKKDAELNAAKNSDLIKANEEAMREAEKEVAAAFAELDQATYDLQNAQSRHGEEIEARDLALADSEKKLKSVTNKLDSITSNFLSEKESLKKQLASVEENWRLKCESLKVQSNDHVDDQLQKNFGELKLKYEKLKEEHKSFCDIADKMIEDKEREIAKLLKENRDHHHSLEANVAVTNNDYQSQVSVKPDTMNVELAEQQILILARQQAQREDELAQSQRHILALQQEIEELERENRLHDQQEAMLKAELRNMERSEKREGIDMTYLKNVILKLLETGEVGALLPVVATLLQFSPDELKKCQQGVISSQTPAVTDGASTPNSFFSRFSF